MQAVGLKVRPDPLTGEVGIGDLTQSVLFPFAIRPYRRLLIMVVLS